MTIRHWQLGSSGGNAFTHSLATTPGASGLPIVNRIEVWERPAGGAFPDGCLQGIRISYNTGAQSPIYGTTTGATLHSITLADTETITSMWVAQVNNNTRIGFLEIRTSTGRFWKHGSTRAPLAWQASIHSGILLGITGRQSSEIHQIGFYSLEQLTRITVDFEYLAMPDPSSIQLIGYDILQGDNRQGLNPLRVAIARSQNVTNSATSEQSWTESLGVSVSVSMGFFGIGESSVGTEWTVTNTQTNSTSYSESSTITWTGEVVVDPGQFTQIDLLYYRGYFVVPYTTRILLHGISGARYLLTRTGNLTGVAAGIGLIRQRHIRSDQIRDIRELKPIEQEYAEEDLPPNTEE